MHLLSSLTTIVNIVGLAACLSLGFYIVTRTVQSRRSWLAAITLWSLSCLFVYNALALNLPEGRTVHWLRPVALLVLPLWLHTTLSLPPHWTQPRFRFYLPAVRLPRPIRLRLGKLAPLVTRSPVPLAYCMGLALWIGGVFPLGHLPATGDQLAVLLSDRAADPLYPLSIAFLILPGLLLMIHLWVGLREAHDRTRRRQFRLLLTATTLAGAGGLYLGLGVWFAWPLPSVLSDLAVATAAAILGLVVAEHNALLEGRDIKRDLPYALLSIGSLAVLCVLIAEALYLTGHIFSLLTLIVVIIVAISALMMYDGVRGALDRLFYHERFRQLRSNLRALAREAGSSQSLTGRLEGILRRLCRTLQIGTGFIALREEDGFVCAATENAAPTGRVFPLQSLSADEMAQLPRPDSPNLADMALLIPLYDGDHQIGALVLGGRETGMPYGEQDLMLLDDLADELADVIRVSDLQEEDAQVISKMITEFRNREHALQRQMQQMLTEREEEARPVVQGITEKEYMALVEDVLRQLHDYSFLGEHTLDKLAVVDWHLEGRQPQFVTHIDRGKALSGVVVQAIEKLRPDGPEPSTRAVPPREWHAYIVLHDAYVRGDLNRDIMSKLYISEGTFNRTRRRAVRAVARALQEMEREALQRQMI